MSTVIDPELLSANSTAAQRQPLVERVRSLKQAGYPTGIITNNVKEFGAGWRAMIPVDELFDLLVDPSSAGVRKPDPRIYRMMCDALGVTPNACVYLDDLGINLKPAREMGMTTIKVMSEDQLLGDLSKATGLAF